MRYADTSSGSYDNDESLDGIEHAEEGEGFGIPGQSTIGTVGTDTGGADGSDTHLVDGEGPFVSDVTKPPANATIQDELNLREFGGVPMSLASRIAYIMENGEPFCNHCETNFIPRTLGVTACTNCGCGKPNDDHNLGDGNFKHVEGPTVADEVGGKDIIKEDATTASVRLASTDDYVNFLNSKEATSSDLYAKGRNDAMAGSELDDDLALLSTDYYQGYEDYKFYNKTPQQSVGQTLFDIKPNSNKMPRSHGDLTPGDYDRGPLELTDGIGHATASKKLSSIYPVDVMQKFLED